MNKKPKLVMRRKKATPPLVEKGAPQTAGETLGYIKGLTAAQAAINVERMLVMPHIAPTENQPLRMELTRHRVRIESLDGTTFLTHEFADAPPEPAPSPGATQRAQCEVESSATEVAFGLVAPRQPPGRPRRDIPGEQLAVGILRAQREAREEVEARAESERRVRGFIREREERKRKKARNHLLWWLFGLSALALILFL